MLSNELDFTGNVVVGCAACVGVAILAIATYEFCISSICEQPQIQYRFTFMLYTFTQSLIPLLVISYFCFSSSHHSKWQRSMAILHLLIQTVSRMLAICCAYSASLHFIFWAHGTVLSRYLRWTQCLSVMLMSLDIIQCIICLVTGHSAAKDLYQCIMALFVVVHSIVICTALFGAIRHVQRVLDRDDQNVSDRDRLEKHLWRTVCVLLLILITMIPVTVSTIFMFDGYADNVRNGHFMAISESPIHSVEEFVVYRLVSAAYCMVLLWWLHIPKSLCCGGCENISEDSLCFSCCIRSCSLLSLEPVPSHSAKRPRFGSFGSAVSGHQYVADFDFFNMDQWRESAEMEDIGGMEQREAMERRARELESSRSDVSTVAENNNVRKRPNMLSPQTISAYNPDYSNTESGMPVPSSDLERDSVEMPDQSTSVSEFH